MRAVIQRVKKAFVDILDDGDTPYRSGEIANGLLVLLAVECGDTKEDAQWLVTKISQLRIFEDADEKMNLSLLDSKGDLLLVSQFTLFGNVKKGNRPSFNRSARPEEAIPLYEYFAEIMEEKIGKKVPRGKFGAMMEVGLINDGPVTIILDSHNKEL